MIDFQQKRRVRHFLYSKPFLIVVGCIMVYAIYTTWTVYQKKIHSEKEISSAEKELLALQEKNRMMSNTIETLQTEQGVEQEIRSKFSLAKQNEHVVVIVEDSSSSSPNIPPQKSLWQAIKQFFSF